MNERIINLRNQSKNAKPTLSIERATLITEFYNKVKDKNLSKPVERAKAFEYILENKKIIINESELIVGERGSYPKNTPTYPEICIHSNKDLKIINDREKINFIVSEEVIKIHNNLILPFWKGQSIREKIFENMNDNWKNAYDAGIFTEFMEQRAPGHTVLDNKIYKKGLLDFRKEILKHMEKINHKKDNESNKKKEQLKAMVISLDAIINFAKRHSIKAKELALKEKNNIRKKELEKISIICEKVPSNPPENFWEALQYYWFIHLGVIIEYNTWDSFNPGRLDQHLYPFYINDLKNGILTKDKAKELLQAFWIKFNNQPAPPKIGITAKESNTYTDFCLINLGGLNEIGENSVNELTFLILEVIEEMRLLQPSSMIQISKKNPNELLRRALKIIKTGFGQPSIFNSDAIIEELIRQGKSKIDARNGGASGCIESGAFGKESYILTGYFNLVKILEITLNNGIDPLTGKKIGLEIGKPENFKTFNEFFNAYIKQLKYFIDIKINGNRIIEKLWSKYLPAPFLSIFIDDCIYKGQDYNSGGARYNTSYIQGVGLGTITDSITSIKYNIFDEKNISMNILLKALSKNFKNYKKIKDILIYDAPKYGNDEDYADEILTQIFNIFFELIDGRNNTKGGKYRINLLPTTSHIYFGSKVGATPDGRKAYQPLSEGISPVQGVDVKGPTAVIKSASKINQIKTGGTLLNQKFSPRIFDKEENIEKIIALIRTYFNLNGHHIQFNVVNAKTLKKAQKNPEKYRDLIVRVAGYSDYFINLSLELQNEIIKRTEHFIK
jgi:formate C-acetyltransferase